MVQDYIYSKRNAWSPVTLRNALATIKAYEAQILTGSPEQLAESCLNRGMKASSLSRLLILADGFYKFCNPTKEAPYVKWRKENRNVFKVKEYKAVGKSYESVKASIKGQAPCWQREKALEILGSAQRSCEAGLGRYGCGNGASRADPSLVLGKGGKLRANLASSSGESGNYYAFYRWLKRCVGVSPHQLRKLALTRAADRGASAADLCAIAGWSDIRTAFVYLQPKENDRLRGFLAED